MKNNLHIIDTIFKKAHEVFLTPAEKLAGLKSLEARMSEHNRLTWQLVIKRRKKVKYRTAK